MSRLFSTSRRSRSFLGIVLLASLTILVCLTGSPSDAAPPKGVNSQAKRPSEKPQAPRSVILKEDDWRRAPLKLVASEEIDALVAEELEVSKIEPATLTTDEQFVRRVSLDLTGQLPKPVDITEFVAGDDPAKRAKLIDRLLESDAYARHWARYWRDVVTARLTQRRSMGLTRSFEEWLYEQLRSGKSWKQITLSILTAEGELRFAFNTPIAENGALFFLVAHDGDEAEERAAETSRVFLGIQLQCAQCHDHPSEPWSRKEFHQLAAYFSRIKYKQLFDNKKLVGVQLVTLPGHEHKMTSKEDPEKTFLTHPCFLDGQAPGTNLSDHDRRQALAEAIVDKKNYWFGAAYVNRVWGELLGQSFYQHVDDLGPMKEVIFPEVLTTLTGSFLGTNYDMKALFRVILNSNTYQRQIILDKAPDRHLHFAAANPTQLRADVVWDSLLTVLGKVEHGARFHTKGGVRFNGSFLEGRFKSEFDFDPSLDQADVKGTIPQALMMMNNPLLNKRIQATKTNLLGHLLKDSPEDAKVLNELYLLTLARKPTDRELKRCRTYIAKTKNRAESYEDILWALINSTEFQTKR